MKSSQFVQIIKEAPTPKAAWDSILQEIRNYIVADPGKTKIPGLGEFWKENGIQFKPGKELKAELAEQIYLLDLEPTGDAREQ